MPELGTASRPLRVAVVGSGPSGFYATEALFKSGKTVEVAMFDRLPTPFGLVRGGVAPDHPKIKTVTRAYEKISTTSGFEFLGNVTVGHDISVETLRKFFDAVIFACGAETDNRLGIPGEDLPGSHTATEFVGWYNGHPDYRDRAFDLSCKTAVVIGQGNVAMDVSRILAKTADELKNTDIADHALDVLAESNIREVHLIGRRGPVQAKFFTPEIKEIGELADCDPVVDPRDLELDPASRTELDDPKSQNSKKNFAVLEEFASRSAPSKSRSYIIHFYKSPIALEGSGKVDRVVLEKNELTGEPFALRARGTGVTESLQCGIFFRSVGYRGTAIPGVPFDERRGVFPNQAGRVLDQDAVVPGLYVAGWIKRGPTGLIGTNKPDSVETVTSLLDDLYGLRPCETPDTDKLRQILAGKGVRVVSFADWHKIDAAEIARGKPKNKPREKFTRIEEMLAVLD